MKDIEIGQFDGFYILLILGSQPDNSGQNSINYLEYSTTLKKTKKS